MLVLRRCGGAGHPTGRGAPAGLRRAALQRQLFGAVVGAQDGTCGGQRAHAVTVGLAQLQAVGQSDAGDLGVLFQRYNVHTSTVASGLFGNEGTARQQ